MAETFTWKPKRSFTVTRTPDVAVVKLGDGYEQRQVKGINPLMDSYSLTFVGTGGSCRENIAKQVNDFLTARMAVEAFNWTPSDTGIQKLFVCRSWSMQKDGPVFTVTATFEQVPK